MPRPPPEAFAFFSDARNLEAITPPWLRFRIVETPATLGRGAAAPLPPALFGVPVGRPGGPLAPLVDAVVRRWLHRIFDYRADRLRALVR